MKLLVNMTILTIAIFGTFSKATADEPSIQFLCGTNYQGVPTTYAKTPRGKVVIIRWVSNYFNASGYTPRKRCQEVSNRFQTYYQQKALRYITTGVMNEQPVICVTNQDGGACEGLLFTLKPEDQPKAVIQKLFNIKVDSTPSIEGNTVEAGGIVTEADQQVYINMNEYLQKAPIEKTK